jgi:hypothetical protein
MKLRIRELSEQKIREKAVAAKEQWLDYHMRKLLGDEMADRATREPALIRTVMKERGIWLREKGTTTELMTEDKVYSKFILEIKA